MFQVNDTILYGTEGICTIEEIGNRKFSGKTQEYYTIRPLYGRDSVIYVPTGSEKLCSRMRKMLSADEINCLLDQIRESGPLWIENEPERKQAYEQVLHTCDRSAALRLLYGLYRHEAVRRESGRRLHVCDERFMKEAQELISREFAHVLHLKPEQIGSFIRDRLHEDPA